MRNALVLLLLVVAQFAWCQLTDVERKGMRDALMVGNLRESDLDFARKQFAEATRLPLIDLALDHPLQANDEIIRLHASAVGAKPSQIMQQLIEKVYQQQVTSLQHDPPISGLDELPADLRGPILGLCNWLNSANNEIRRATSELTPEEKRSLIESLPVWAVEEPSVSFSFVRGKVLSQPEILSLMRKVDLPRIRAAATRLSEAVERAIELLRTSRSDVSSPLHVRVGGMPIVIAGLGTDVHTDTDALLTIDLGGDDRYIGRHGAGVGYASVLIDMGGDDTYKVGDLSIGAGLLGVGLAFDLGGDDTFEGRGLTFGSGLGGVGALIKTGGRDTYVSSTLSQGFGQFGIGLLVDSGGIDTYDLSLYGQGAARTEGVGWLIDLKGRDIYRAGGLVLNSPLFADVHYSFAQGFGAGYREDTGGVGGGVGLLTDIEGDDTYIGETYQQAASYWFSFGSLYDASGNDSYTGHHYCQSSAMHMCAAFLYDLSGDDSYTVKVGAAHAIGHDYGVALLLDRKGDDIFSSRDSTPGIGNANGLGMFIDGGGIDRYYGPPGKGNGARGTGSLGVFVDLNGDDDYRYGLKDGQARATELWGVALDLPTAADDPLTAVQERARPVPGSQSLPSDAEMSAIYAKAVQWGVGTAQVDVLDNLDRLVSIGGPALKWMLDNRLRVADRLHIRAFVHVTQALGVTGSQLVGAKAFTATDVEMLPLLRIAIDARVMDFGSVLPGLMKKPELQRLAVTAAGTLKATAAVPDLMAFCRSSDKLLARAAMVSLEQIGDAATASTAQAMIFTDDLMTRKAALGLLAQFPETAMSAAEQITKSNDEFRCRVGVELFGRIGSADALMKIGAFLKDARSGVRIEAARQLAGRCPETYLVAFLSLKDDRDPMVRSVVALLDPSRG